MQVLLKNLILCFLILGTSAFFAGGNAIAQTVIPQSGWTLHYVDSEELVGEDGAATNAFDGQPLTLWHTQWSGNPDPPHPHDLQVDLGAGYQVEGIRYLPRQDNGKNGRIGQYEVYVATDSGTPPTTPPILSQWTLVASGAFPNSAAEQEVLFTGVTSRYVWLRALSEGAGTGKPFTTVGELNVLGTLSSGVGITPTAATVSVLGQQDFDGVGGVPPYTFNVVADTSGGASVNATTGLYTAGPNAGTSTVRVTDDNLDTADALVIVQGGGGPSNQAPAVSAGPDQTITLPNDATLNGTVTDDGLPSPPGSLTTTWSKVSGPGTVTFGNATAVDTMASFSMDGVYVLRLTANDSALTGSDDLTIMVNPEGGGSGGGVNISNLIPVSYEVVPAPPGLQVGGLIYIDRNRTFTSIPTSVQGATYIQTANDDKAATANPFLSFTVDQFVTVYVAHDGRLALPAWLTNMGFTDTGENLVAASTSFDLFAQTFPAGPITLGGNESSGCCMMYSVIVKAASGGAPLTITPPAVTVSVLGQQDFNGVGGVPPYTFNVVADTSGGASVNATTGLYTGGPNAGTSTVRVTDDNLDTVDALVTAQGGGGSGLIDQSGWTLHYVDSEELVGEDGAATNAFDGQPLTLWHTQWSGNPDPPHPHDLQVDLGAGYQVDGIRYLPRQDGGINGRIGQYEVYVATDSGTPPTTPPILSQWTLVASGAFPNSAAEQEVLFTGVTSRYVWLRALSEGAGTGKPFTTVGELNVLGTLSSGVGITPTAATVSVLGQQDFDGVGGVPPYTFNVVADTSGGASVNTTTGLYTAGPNPGTSTVRVTDDNLNTVDAGITVFTNAGLIPQASWTVHFVNSQEAGSPAANAFDGTSSTKWRTQNGVSFPHDLQVNLGNVYELEGFRIIAQTPIEKHAISFFEFYVSEDGISWGPPVASGELSKDFSEMEVNFPRIAGQFVRIRPLGWHDGGTRVEIGELNVLGASFSGNYAPNGTIDAPIDNVTINVGGSVSFAGMYTDSNGDSPLSFLWDFGDSAVPDATSEDPGLITFSNPGTYTVTFTVTDPFGLSDPIPGTVVVKVLAGANSVLPRNDWAIEFVNSEEVILDSNAAANVFDGNTNTIWHSQWKDVEGPHEIQIDLGAAFAIDAFRYLPRSSGANGRIDYYHIYVSPDGRDWGTPVAIGQFANTATEQRVQFSPKIGQFIRLVAITEVNGNRWASMAEANVEGVCQDPFVRIINPLTNEVQGRPDLPVTASVCLAQAVHAGWGVKFSVDSGAQEKIITLPTDGVIHPDTFQWTFTGLSGDNHQVEAFIVDDQVPPSPVSGNSTSDMVTNIGLGDVFSAIGDSITVGVGDDDNTDGTSQDGRNTNTGLGFIPVLNDILTNERGYPHNIHNDGISGDSSAGLLIRAPKILKSRKKTSAFLILIGSNDANSGLIPSGKGPNPPGPGTFKDNLKKIIDLLHNPAQGREVYLAKVPYTTNAASDQFILDYNIAIQELVTENSLPDIVPDFYTHFLANQLELQSDGLHPSGNGYKSMASIWCIEVSGGACPIP